MKLKLVKSLSLMALAVATLPLTTHAQLIISEVHSTGSSSTNYTADWFEIRNVGLLATNITGWKVDDSSASFATALTLRGVTTIAPGQAVVFMESDAAGTLDATKDAAFKSAWFGGSVPSGFTLGFYGGSAIGLSSSGDGVNIFNAIGTLLASVSFGGATTGVSFDNAAGLSGTISQLSIVGVNEAFSSFNGGEIGSPGVVPEPSSLGLLALGAVAALIARSKRQR